MKHNKKRNTAFIYETLALEFTKAIVKKDSERKEKIIAILKEFFTKGDILAQEREFYDTLLETSSVHPKIAQRLLEEVKKGYAGLNAKMIFGAQSQVIATINKKLGQGVWGNFIPNFKTIASVNAIFNPKTTIKKKVLFEQAIVDRMSESGKSEPRVDLRSIDNLTYNSFIQKFNDRYGQLLREQKDLLNRYIVSFADDGFELRLYLNEELSRLKGLLNEVVIANVEPLISQKANEVLDYLESFRKREFTETDLNKVLKTQELVQELAIHDHN